MLVFVSLCNVLGQITQVTIMSYFRRCVSRMTPFCASKAFKSLAAYWLEHFRATSRLSSEFKVYSGMTC